MRTLRVIVAAYALVLVLGAPALLLAAEGDPAEPAAPADPAATADQELVPIEEANQPPTAAFLVQPDLDPADDSVAVGQGETVTLDASGSSDPEGAPARFEWDLDGDGVFESDAGPGAVLTHAFATPGTFDVRLRVTDAGGAAAEEKKAITVAAPLESEPAAEPAPPADVAPAPAEPAPAPRARKAKREPSTDDGPNARAAASASVSIVDFSFRPRSVTVNVGDTVTWINNGDQAHTATADDGSFDTGNLRTGASGSHTFNSPGTFSYICKPHPFMKGTVEVRGGGGGGGGGGDDAGAAGTDDSGAGTAGDDAAGGSGDSLAQTGIDVLPLMGLGTLMLLMGAALGRNLPDTRP